MKDCLNAVSILGRSERLLIVGHAISGFYLLQVASHKPSVEYFDSPSQMINAEYIDVNY